MVKIYRFAKGQIDLYGRQDLCKVRFIKHLCLLQSDKFLKGVLGLGKIIFFLMILKRPCGKILKVDSRCVTCIGSFLDFYKHFAGELSYTKYVLNKELGHLGEFNSLGCIMCCVCGVQ